jgi:regulator of replication initiation timing
MACLGLIAFHVIWLHITFRRSLKENLRSFHEFENRLTEIHNEVKHLKQTPSGKVPSTSSLSAEIENLRIEICSIKKRISIDSSPIMPSQHSLQKNETDNHPKHINEGYVDDVKGNEDNGYFAGFNPTQSNDSCYHIFNIKGNRAEFKAIDFKSINGHNAATKAVVFSGIERKDATNIEKQVPGVVERGNDGYWEITTKAQIKLI